MSLAKLILSEPFRARKHILLNKSQFLIGRADDCDLILDRPSVSKHHTSLSFDGQDYILEDLQSKNGTLVNGRTQDRCVLRPRDLITIGGLDLLFEMLRKEEWEFTLERNVTKFKSAMESTKALTSHLALDPVLDAIMDSLMRLTQAERGFLLMKVKDEFEMVRSVKITSQELKDARLKLSLSAVQRAAEEKQSVVISNAMDDTYFGDRTSVQEMELKTLVCIPIVLESQVIGILYADSNRKEQEFTQLDVEVLEYLAANAAVAMENAKLNQEIWKLIQKTSNVLEEVEEKANLDPSLQNSIRSTLDSLTTLSRRRLEKDPLSSDTI